MWWIAVPLLPTDLKSCNVFRHRTSAPKGVDQRFYRYPDEGEWTARLDLACSANDCLVTNQTSARRGTCDDKVSRTDSSLLECSETGYAHPVSGFAVRIETQKKAALRKSKPDKNSLDFI